MRTHLIGVLMGIIPGLAVGVWVGSSPSLPFSEWRENAQGEAFYQGRPASFWLLQATDHDTMYRLQAVQALESIAAHDPSVISTLGGMLKDPAKLVRIGVAGALRRLGAAAQAALPELLAALDDEDQFVRTNVVDALGHIAPRDQAIMQALTRALEDESPTVRSMAASALGVDDRRTNGSSAALPELGADSPDVREGAVETPKTDGERE